MTHSLSRPLFPLQRDRGNKNLRMKLQELLSSFSGSRLRKELLSEVRIGRLRVEQRPFRYMPSSRHLWWFPELEEIGQYHLSGDKPL